MRRISRANWAAGIILTLSLVTSASGTSVNASTASRNSDAGDHADGWRYVPIEQAFSSDVAIVGLADVAGQLQVTVRSDVVKANSIQYTTTYRSAAWNETTNTLSVSKRAAHAPAGYAGPIRLDFPSQFPTKFQTQPVKVERVTKSESRVVAAWPSAIPLYGSAANPQTDATPGSIDNRIVGTSGSWLWVVLKGPQYPPLYPKQGPLIFGFRYWNRLVALNTKTGAYRLYDIPRTYSLYQSEWGMDSPAFVQVGSRVYVAVGSWIGEFQADPGAVATSSVPIRVAAPQALAAKDGVEALNDLRMLRWQEVNGLAAYWNSVMGTHVPGMPLYGDGGGPPTWNRDPVIFNHGAYPAKLIWAMEFPFMPGSPQDEERTQLGKSIVSLLTSSLNGYAESAAVTSYTPVRKAFGGKAPMRLPGYTIRDNAYWPSNQSILDLGVPSLPSAYPSYGVITRSVGTLLTMRSPVPVLLPYVGPKHSDVAAINPPHGSYLNVRYQLNDGSVPNGYELTVSIGPKTPANAPNIDAGNANLEYSTAGVPKGDPLPQDLRWTAQASIPGGHATRVNLGHGVWGTVWTGQYQGKEAHGVTWKQDGLTWIIPPSTWGSVDPVSDARHQVTQLDNMRFALDVTGYGIFGYGSDAPSEVVLHTYGATYAIYATGWRAAKLAFLMDFLQGGL